MSVCVWDPIDNHTESWCDMMQITRHSMYWVLVEKDSHLRRLYSTWMHSSLCQMKKDVLSEKFNPKWIKADHLGEGVASLFYWMFQNKYWRLWVLLRQQRRSSQHYARNIQIYWRSTDRCKQSSNRTRKLSHKYGNLHFIHLTSTSRFFLTKSYVLFCS